MRRTEPADAVEVCVPTREFIRGCEEEDRDCYPRHAVRVSAFYIDRYSTTVRRYQECVAAGACSALEPFDYISPADTLRRTITFDDLAFDDPDVPVWTASFEQAGAFCEWDAARLPTGAEWELAALGTLEEGLVPWWSTRSRPPVTLCRGYGSNRCETIPPGPRAGYSFDSVTAPVSTIGVQNMYWFFEWSSDSLAPYIPQDPPELDPHSDGEGHELRGGVLEAHCGTFAIDIAARDATVNWVREVEWGDREHASIRCARKAEGSR